MLQLLTQEHAICQDANKNELGSLICILGGESGKDVNKRLQCERLGYAWNELDIDDSCQWPSVLPGCIYYLHLELQGDLIDCGSHEVALCRVVSMTSDDAIESAAMELDYLSTRNLRAMGIISEFGRIASPES